MASGAAVFGFVQRGEAERQANLARLAEEKTREVASRANLYLARYSLEAGNDARALALLAQALRLNQRNYGAGALTGAMLSQANRPIPAAVAMGMAARFLQRSSVRMGNG
jgi:hypothetical protein